MAEKQYANIKYDVVDVGYPLCPYLPIGAKPITKAIIQKTNVQPPPLAMPGSNLPRALNYIADYSGCGFWRMGAPELLLNYNQKMVINTLTSMVIDPNFYTSGYSSIKIQRQASPIQKEFTKFLKVMGKTLNSKIIYEVDDIVFGEDIPLFNRCRSAFTDPEIRKSIEEIIEMCDEFCVVSEYMRDYYKSKTKNQNVTVLPNYAPRMWFDRFYDEAKILKDYQTNKNRPKVLITGSGTHYDVINANNQKDDYAHVLQSIIKSRKDFQWIFMGGFPLLLKPFIDNGDILFKDWSPLLYFANGIDAIRPQVSIAALADNHFNRAKSSIKSEECGHLGIPFIGQRLDPYKNCKHQFDTGSEMVDIIKDITKDETSYMENVKAAHTYSDQFWLDDDRNLMKHVELYTTPYGSKDRKYLLENNPIIKE